MSPIRRLNSRADREGSTMARRSAASPNTKSPSTVENDDRRYGQRPVAQSKHRGPAPSYTAAAVKVVPRSTPSRYPMSATIAVLSRPWHCAISGPILRVSRWQRGGPARRARGYEMKLGIREIYEAARAAGFSPDQATTWTAIALAESGGETGRAQPIRRGLARAVADQRRPGRAGEQRLGQPERPIRQCPRGLRHLATRGLDMRPWTTTHASNAAPRADYRTYLDGSSAVTGYTGDLEGSRATARRCLSRCHRRAPDEPTTAPTPTSYDAIDRRHAARQRHRHRQATGSPTPSRDDRQPGGPGRL